jgi:hypothetical protein
MNVATSWKESVGCHNHWFLAQAKGDQAGAAAGNMEAERTGARVAVTRRARPWPSAPGWLPRPGASTPGWTCDFNSSADGSAPAGP